MTSKTEGFIDRLVVLIVNNIAQIEYSGRQSCVMFNDK